MSKRERTKIVNSQERCEEMVAEVRRQFRQHRYVEFTWVEGGQRTMTQNRALHLWFRFLAETLNDAGLDMRTVIREDVDLPWSEHSVKEHIWRPVQKALQGKESTTESDRTEYTEVRDVIARHLGEKFGVQAPEWPKRKDDEVDQRLWDACAEDAGKAA